MEKNGHIVEGNTGMKNSSPEGFWEEQNHAWRDPSQVTVQWMGATPPDPVIFRYRESGDFFSILGALQITLLVTREYEHLVMAITTIKGSPVFSYLSIPHPSGIAVDTKREIVYIASTRNPNMVFEFSPLKKNIERLDVRKNTREDLDSKILLPRQTNFFPGCYYIHDLAMIDGVLHANSVGQNSVVRVDRDDIKIVWWPHCIEKAGQPVFGQNHIQLNSIAAGENLDASFFSASADKISSRRPGHLNFPVDKRGVIFSGKTREPIVFGLTRPHSARLHKNQIYVDNSGYGEFILVTDRKPIVLSKLPGWTRGLGLYQDIAFVGTSRVISRFRQYAPGVDVDKSICGIHAVDARTGNVLGSMYWPYGNQIFAIEPIPQNMTPGFPVTIDRRNSFEEQKKIYYAFSLTIPSPKLGARK
jgi:uncharacterized protein (TIGR03032 family)